MMLKTEKNFTARPVPASDVPALELRGVTKKYGELTVLQPTDLAVGAHEFVTLLGPSGSGKTTILGIAAGISEPHSGQVISNGRDVTNTPPHLRNVGMVFQRYTLFPNKTVLENVRFPLDVRKIPAGEARRKALEFLDLVGLGKQADRYPSEISGGQAQRVALARALVFGPDLLLMDEPLGALDRRLRQNLQEEIRRIQRETRVPTLYVTHDQEEAMNLSDRIVIAKDGRIVANDSPRALYQSPPSHWAAEFLGDSNSRRVAKGEMIGSEECLVSTECGLSIHARRHPAVDDMANAVLVIRPEDIAVDTLEDSRADGIEGDVVNIAFLGPVQHANIRLASGWLVRAFLSGRKDLQVGDRVRCHWTKSSPIVVPS